MWDPKQMQQAIICVRTKKFGYTKAAKIFKVPRTTLRRLVASDLPPEECVNTRLGRKPIMSPELEAQLVEYLSIIENQFYGLTRSDVRKMAYQLAVRNKLKHSFGCNEIAGRAWFDHFIRRHSKLTIHKATGTSYSRIQGLNKESLSAFYIMLKNVYEGHNYSANRIFNVSETGLSIVQSKIPHVIGLKGKKQVSFLISAIKGSFITVIYFVSAGRFSHFS